MKPLPEQKACPHAGPGGVSAWAPRPGGYRYECRLCEAWGRKLPGGQIVMYADGGRSGLADEQRARLDEHEAEQDRAALDEIHREDEDWG